MTNWLMKFWFFLLIYLLVNFYKACIFVMCLSVYVYVYVWMADKCQPKFRLKLLKCYFKPAKFCILRIAQFFFFFLHLISFLNIEITMIHFLNHLQVYKVLSFPLTFRHAFLYFIFSIVGKKNQDKDWGKCWCPCLAQPKIMSIWETKWKTYKILPM